MWGFREFPGWDVYTFTWLKGSFRVCERALGLLMGYEERTFYCMSRLIRKVLQLLDT